MNIFYKKIKDHYHEVLSSVKVVEVEEKFDLLFSRFFGLYIARVSNMLHMTPNQLTIWSMVVGMAGGSFLYFQGGCSIHTHWLGIGCLFRTAR